MFDSILIAQKLGFRWSFIEWRLAGFRWSIMPARWSSNDLYHEAFLDKLSPFSAKHMLNWRIYD